MWAVARCRGEHLLVAIPWPALRRARGRLRAELLRRRLRRLGVGDVVVRGAAPGADGVAPCGATIPPNVCPFGDLGERSAAVYPLSSLSNMALRSPSMTRSWKPGLASWPKPPRYLWKRWHRFSEHDHTSQCVLLMVVSSSELASSSPRHVQGSAPPPPTPHLTTNLGADRVAPGRATSAPSPPVCPHVERLRTKLENIRSTTVDDDRRGVRARRRRSGHGAGFNRLSAGFGQLGAGSFALGRFRAEIGSAMAFATEVGLGSAELGLRSAEFGHFWARFGPSAEG